MDVSPVRLEFDQWLPANPVTGKLAANQYHIVETLTGQRAGTIRLRLSNGDEVRYDAGHIGYSVDEAFRGRHYAAYASLELKPVALRYGFTELWITCNPDNWASRRTCERIGAQLVDIIDLPADNDTYCLNGERQKCRYTWQLV